jgi:hypothetical protein
MAIKVKISPLLKVLRKDEKYVRLKETFSTHENFRLPVEQLIEELKDSHKIRQVRRLNPTDPEFAKKVISAILDDQAKRSRATEILVRAVRAESLMQNALDSLKYHLLLTYSEELRSFRTKEERLQIINTTLKQFNTFLKNVNVLKETANLIVMDIDKAAWSLKSVISVLELHTRRESHV